jgi:hypothetical protein
MPTGFEAGDGHLVLPIYTVPASAFADELIWNLMGDFERLDLYEPDLS